METCEWNHREVNDLFEWAMKFSRWDLNKSALVNLNSSSALTLKNDTKKAITPKELWKHTVKLKIQINKRGTTPTLPTPQQTCLQ